MSINNKPIGRRFNRLFFSLVISVLLIITGTNAIIDPKNQLGWLHIERLNTIKYLATGGRYEKSARLANGSYDTLLVGSSRTQVGIDPDQPALSNYRTYNAALSGTNMQEVSAVLLYALRHQEIKRVFIGLDFLLFTQNNKLAADFHDSLFNDSWSWLMPYLLSTSTFKRSIKTIKLNREDSSRVHSNKNGFLDKTGSEINHRLRFTEVLSKTFLVDPEYYGAYLYSHDAIRRLATTLKICLRQNIEVTLFISPVHARQLEAIRAMGLWDDYQRWQYDLASLIHRLKVEHKATVRLWNFAGYNSITTETVPASGTTERMQWYWESSHYKKSLGRLMMNTMLNRAPSTDFGRILNLANINKQQNIMEINRAFYSLKYPEEIADIARLVNETRADRILRARQALVTPLQAK